MKLSFEEIATRQLAHPLDLYLSRGDLVCAITLAGAAEEILGKLAESAGHVPSLRRSSLRKVALFKAIFPRNKEPTIGEFFKLSNKPRNMMRHLLRDPIAHIDLEYEAGKLLKRAVENYRLAVGPKTPKMRRFESERIRRARE